MLEIKFMFKLVREIKLMLDVPVGKYNGVLLIVQPKVRFLQRVVDNERADQSVDILRNIVGVPKVRLNLRLNKVLSRKKERKAYHSPPIRPPLPIYFKLVCVLSTRWDRALRLPWYTIQPWRFFHE